MILKFIDDLGPRVSPGPFLFRDMSPPPVHEGQRADRKPHDKNSLL